MIDHDHYFKELPYYLFRRVLELFCWWSASFHLECDSIHFLDKFYRDVMVGERYEVFHQPNLEDKRLFFPIQVKKNFQAHSRLEFWAEALRSDFPQKQFLGKRMFSTHKENLTAPYIP